jgi:hypothetical protein
VLAEHRKEAAICIQAKNNSVLTLEQFLMMDFLALMWQIVFSNMKARSNTTISEHVWRYLHK